MKLEGEGEGGTVGGGVGGVPQKAAGPVSLFHTCAHTHTCTHAYPPPWFKRRATQICIILRVLNFQPVSFFYFNKATNQC